MKFDFKNKRVLITGCNGNLGSKITKKFLSLNAKVIGIDLNKKTLIKSKNLKYYDVNLLQSKEIEDLFKKIKKEKIDILINNAAVSFKGIFEKRTDEQFQYTFDANLLAPLKLIKFFCRDENKSKKKIVVNIASIYGSISPDHSLYKENKKNNSEIYGATKAGLIQITKYFSQYYGKKNIRFNSISPGGFLDSKIFKDKIFLKKYSKKVPLERMGNPEEIIPSVIFLSSEFSSYINGHNLIIDGGMSS